MNKKKNIVFYTLFMIMMFIIVSGLINGVGTVMFANYFNNIINNNKYGYLMYIELSVCISILIVLLLSGNKYIFNCEKESFLKSMKKGWPLYIIMLFSIIPNMALSVLEHGINKTNLITLALYCICIGIYEEFLCRGWLQNEFIERFGNDRKGVIKSIVISSLIFGLMHLSNISVQSTFDTILQIINALSMGMLLGSIYYKSNNIWTVIVLHALWDFGILFTDHALLMDCSYTGAITLSSMIVSSLSIIIISIYYICSSIIIMKSKKTVSTDKLIFEKKNTSKLTKIIIYMLVLSYLVVFIPTDNGDYKKVCYDFKEITVSDYTLHVPSKKSYLIGEKTKLKLYIEDEKAIIEDEYNNKVSLPYDEVYGFDAIENKEGYTLLLTTNDYKVYYSNFISKANISNSNDYIKSIIDSFEEKYFPYSSYYGYMNIEDDVYNYPILKNYYNELYTIDKEGYETFVKTE